MISVQYLEDEIKRLLAGSDASDRDIQKYVSACIVEFACLALTLPATLSKHFTEFSAFQRDAKQNKTMDAGEHEKTLKNLLKEIKSKKKLERFPLLAALCTKSDQLKNLEYSSKYNSYRSAVIVASLYALEQSDNESATKEALRTLRLTASRVTHIDLIRELPIIRGDEKPQRIPELLRKKEESQTINEYTIKKIAQFRVVLERGINRKDGIYRSNITVKKNQPSSTIEAENTSYSEDSDFQLELIEVTHESHTREDLEIDSYSKNRTFLNGNDKKYQFPFYKEKQAKKNRSAHIARKLKSLNCLPDQLTPREIKILIENCQSRTQDAAIPLLILLSLYTGIALEKTHEKVKIKIIGDKPFYIAATRELDTRTYNNSSGTHKRTIKQFELPLPAEMVTLINRHRSHSDEGLARQFIKQINKNEGARISLSKIARYKYHWYRNQGIDTAEYDALQSTSIKHNYRLAYTIQDKTSILSNHIKYINHLIPNKKLDEAKTPKYEKRSERIISQSRMKEILSNIFGPPMSHKGKTIEQLFEFHNKYVISVWFILSLVTGHRSVNEPLGTLSDFNKHNKTWIIGDKERRSVSALRTVILPDLAVKQLDYYLEHLDILKRRTATYYPDIHDEIQNTLNGNTPLLFYINDEKTERPQTEWLNPSLIKSKRTVILEYQQNIGRHLIRNHLLDSGIHHEAIDGWMGHEEAGNETFNKFSMNSLRDIKNIALSIESLLSEAKFKPAKGLVF